MTATARQDKSEANRALVRDLLTRSQPELAASLGSDTAVRCPRCGGWRHLPAALHGHAFLRAGCKLAAGEPLLAARARGYAAEAAEDAFRAIRSGDLTDARALLHAALTYLDSRDARMEAAR